jgi:hypothetical protein
VAEQKFTAIQYFDLPPTWLYRHKLHCIVVSQDLIRTQIRPGLAVSSKLCAKQDTDGGLQACVCVLRVVEEIWV